jgi:hypothetical protein
MTEEGTIELKVRLSPEEVMSRISSMMDKYTPFEFFTYTGEKKFAGKIEGMHFRIQKKIFYMNSWNYVFFGGVRQIQNGSLIRGCLRMHSFAEIFMIVWFGGISVFALLGVLMTFAGEVSVGKGILFIAMPLAMLVFGAVLARVGMRTGKRDGNEAVTAFLELFSDVLM